jgi:TetR/AcrR family transcriptional repressor of nem operon
MFCRMGRSSDARERLVEATIELVWQNSYGGVSVDAICERAAVKKGSFYHFFRSKDDLVLAALDAHWESRRPILDRLFSPSVPPLQRLNDYFAYVYKRQLELKAKSGVYLGCFFSAVGVECTKQNPEIAAKVKAILANYTRYYESALRDAAAQGEIRIDDLPSKARSLFAFMEGVLSQARIQNDAELIRNLRTSAFAFLGIEEARPARTATR